MLKKQGIEREIVEQTIFPPLKKSITTNPTILLIYQYQKPLIIKKLLIIGS